MRKELFTYHRKQIPGLKKALSVPDGNVTSIYSPQYVNRHFEALKKFKSGNIIFTFPNSPVKCPGAPQKICYITEHYLRKVSTYIYRGWSLVLSPGRIHVSMLLQANKRDAAKVIYNTALPVIFGVKHYADALWKVVEKRNIEVNLKTELVEVIGDKNIAVFASVDDPKTRTEVEVGETLSLTTSLKMEFIHVKHSFLPVRNTACGSTSKCSSRASKHSGVGKRCWFC